MKKLGLGLLVTSLLFLGGCTKKADNSAPIIKVNDSVITEKMFKNTFDSVFNTSALASRGVDINDPKNKFTQVIFKSRAVNDLIVKELIKQEAEKRDLKVSSGEVKQTIEDIIKRFGNKSKFEATLALNNIKKEAFEENVKFDLLKRKLVESISGTQEISDEKVKEFYEKNKDAHFIQPEKVRARHILISASEADIKSEIASKSKKENVITKEDLEKKVETKMAAARKKAEDILKQLKKNPDKFAELAKENSEDPSSAVKGGDLGFFTKDEMVPEFARAAYATKPGNLSEVVKTEFGYHIIKVEDRQKGGPVPFDEVKDNIKKYLEGKTKMDSLAKLIESSKQSAEIVFVKEDYDPDKLKEEIKSLAKEKIKTKQTEKEDKQDL